MWQRRFFPLNALWFRQGLEPRREKARGSVSAGRKIVQVIKPVRVALAWHREIRHPGVAPMRKSSMDASATREGCHQRSTGARLRERDAGEEDVSRACHLLSKCLKRHIRIRFGEAAKSRRNLLASRMLKFRMEDARYVEMAPVCPIADVSCGARGAKQHEARASERP